MHLNIILLDIELVLPISLVHSNFHLFLYKRSMFKMFQNKVNTKIKIKHSHIHQLCTLFNIIDIIHQFTQFYQRPNIKQEYMPRNYWWILYNNPPGQYTPSILQMNLNIIYIKSNIEHNLFHLISNLLRMNHMQHLYYKFQGHRYKSKPYNKNLICHLYIIPQLQ